MTDNQFVYWLQGFAELNGDAPPTKEQWDSIREHLALQFNKVTPPTLIASPGHDLRLAPQKAGDSNQPLLIPVPAGGIGSAIC